MILHDWNSVRTLQILRSCKKHATNIFFLCRQSYRNCILFRTDNATRKIQCWCGVNCIVCVCIFTIFTVETFSFCLLRIVYSSLTIVFCKIYCLMQLDKYYKCHSDNWWLIDGLWPRQAFGNTHWKTAGNRLKIVIAKKFFFKRHSNLHSVMSQFLVLSFCPLRTLFSFFGPLLLLFRPFRTTFTNTKVPLHYSIRATGCTVSSTST